MSDAVNTVNNLTPFISPLLTIILSGLSGLGIFWSLLAKYREKIDNLEKTCAGFSVKIENLQLNNSALNEFKIQTQKFIDKGLYKASSPLSLTDEGLELVNKSGFISIFEKEKNNLSQLLQKMNPATKYDTQEMARGLMDSLREYPAFLPIKTFAFNNGKDYGQILRAGGIILRDYYLSIHPEIKN